MFDERDDRDFDIGHATVLVESAGLTSNISNLVPFLGLERARTIKTALEAAVVGDSTPTAYKRIAIFRRFMFVAGTQESVEPAWADLMAEFRKCPSSPPPQRVVEAAAQAAFRRLSDSTDFCFCGTDNCRTRQNYWLELQGVLKKLASIHYLPNVSLYGKIQYETGRTPVLADLAYEEGRLGPFDSWEDQELKYLEMNRTMMKTLRAALVSQFEDEHQQFARGNALKGALSLTVEEIDEELQLRGEFYGARLGSTGSERRLAIALKLFHAMVYDDFKPSANCYRLDHFFSSVGGKSALRPYLGATPRALVAAFHIILIDTGWNPQVCGDLSDEPFTGGIKRGHRTLRSVASKKIRAGDKLIEAPIPDFDAEESENDAAQTTMSLQAKLPNGELSSVQLIEMWLTMTKPLRDRAERIGDPSSKALWIWRSREGSYAINRLHEIATIWWSGFLNEHKNDEVFGGLSITRRMLRKTYGHIHSASGSFFTNLSMALLDHDTERTNRLYLSETTIRVRYDTLIRKFMDLWEAVVINGIEDAAQKLGLDTKVLELRYNLGLASGFGFANVKPSKATVSNANSSPPWTLGKNARIFVPRPESLIELHLARLAMKKGEEAIASVNPDRWTRMWLPWKAITDAVHQKLLSSMHSVRYRKAIAEAERRLANSEASLPAVW
ncbi:hypothetical protein A6U86_15555 [Rhizobium sp. AC27/96]|uniref:hypothetical protein n=1 Tax=Rhizobium sp. AC27/96 TaxID=1841653 RepID=UPI0008282EDE|nr:hypothetical protein [Rhizobium sp. AC27/96]OCI97027.1 hypothetical protein A6U86_15555 [Rhizobium sp. AC27/96]